MPIGTDAPMLTDERAALVALVADYARGAQVHRSDLVRPGASLAHLAGEPIVRAHVKRVRELVDGWESAYATELLASIHYAVRTDATAVDDIDRLTEFVHTWSTRKREIFSRSNIERARERLDERGWLIARRAIA
jgi:hypothetical protein